MNLSILMFHLFLLLVIKKKLKYVEKLTIHGTQSRGGGAIRVINKAGGRGDKSDQCDQKKNTIKSLWINTSP